MHNCECMKISCEASFFFGFVVCNRCRTCGIWSKKQPNAEVKWIYPLLTNTARGGMCQISHTRCVRPNEPFFSCSILHYNSWCGRHTVCRKSQPNIIHSLAQFEISLQCFLFLSVSSMNDWFSRAIHTAVICAYFFKVE